MKLKSLLKQLKGKQDKESSSPSQSIVPAPDPFVNGPTRHETTPLISFDSRQSRFRAGRDYGSNNVAQQGDGIQIVIGYSDQTHIHTVPNVHPYQAVSGGISLVRDAQLTEINRHRWRHTRRDTGSKNAVQQEEDTKIAFGDFNQFQVHLHTRLNDDFHQVVLDRILEKLESYIAKDAILTKGIHGKPSVCYQDTRARFLDDILLWVRADHISHSKDTIDVSHHTLCLEGAPGAGKSTIMYTMAIKLLEEAQRREPDLNTAHYMIRRNLQTTTDAQKVLPTIAYQLASRSLEVAQKMMATLDSIPHTGVLSPTLQSRLFLETIEAFHSKVFIIVDALDESSEPDALTATLSHIIRRPPRNLRLLLATRPEHDVLVNLGDDLVPKIVRSISTRESCVDVDSFIASRLMDGVKVIFGSSPRWAGWPRVSQIRDLSYSADGLYIWAVTSVDFILSQVKRRGVINRDRWIEEAASIGQGTKNVDALYRLILNNYLQDYQGNVRCTALDRARGVLGFIVTAEHALSLDDIIKFLHFNDFDVHHFVEVVRSILVPGTGPVVGSTLIRIHKTFSDFITSDRAAEFMVYPQGPPPLAVDRCCSLMETRIRLTICGLTLFAIELALRRPRRERRDSLARLRVRR